MRLVNNMIKQYSGSWLSSWKTISANKLLYKYYLNNEKEEKWLPDFRGSMARRLDDEMGCTTESWK